MDEKGYTELNTNDNEPNTSFSLTRCETKALLTKKEAMDALWIPNIPESKRGKFKFISLFEHIIKVISKEQTDRFENTIKGLFTRRIVDSKTGLDDLIKVLNDAEDDADIKQIIRAGLNQQDIHACRQTYSHILLWEDIRATLNEEIGFQPSMPRPRNYKNIIANKTPTRFSYALNSIFGTEESIDYSGGVVDKVTKENMLTTHKLVEESINSLMERQGVHRDDRSTRHKLT